MKKHTTSFHVDVPLEVAFAYMADPATTMPAMSKMELIHETPEHIGTVYRYEERFLGLRFTGLFVVTEFVENERIKGEFSGGLEEGEGLWTFEPVDSGTDVTVEPDFRVRIPVVGRLATRLMMRAFEGTWVPALKTEMKEYAETRVAETAP
jgi:carbon monoxide dehydrogenase subunit G